MKLSTECTAKISTHNIFTLCQYDYYLSDTIKVKRILSTQDSGIIVTESVDLSDIHETPIYNVYDISAVTRDTVYNFLVKHNIIKKAKSIKAKMYILKYIDRCGSLKVTISDSIPNRSIDEAYCDNMKYVGFDEVEIEV